MKKLCTTFLMVLIGFSTYAQWNQLGLDIDGANAGDLSGRSVGVSSDGLTVAIGAHYGGPGTNVGHVRVFHFNGTGWNQIGADIDGEANFDGSGWSLSMSPDGLTLAIGAKGNDGNGTSAGHVRVYQYNGANWIQQGADIDGEAASDASGVSVSISSNGLSVAIGAASNDGSGINAGHVRVYQFNGTNWIQQGGDIDGEVAGDLSGGAVSISADGLTVAIGAKNNDDSGSNAGHVRVYHYNGTSWIQQGVDIDGEAAYDLSGISVSINADGLTVAIGAQSNDGGGSGAGHVRVYHYNGTSWVQQGADIDGEAAGDVSGSAVSISADGLTVAISATGNDDSALNAGQVRVYKYNGTSWIQQGIDIDGEAADDYSGMSLSLSADGLTVAIGASSNDGAGASAGHVRVYSFCAPGQGADTQTACGSYTWIDGMTYSSTTSIPTFNIVGGAANGCDSLATLNLTINPVPDNTTTTAGLTITASQAGATYQWIDCNNGNSFISGETSASYTATTSGDYAVIVTNNGCSDTSACVNISTVGVNETAIGNQVIVYPNPIKDLVTVQLGNLKEVSLLVYSLTGEIVYQATNINSATHQFELNSAAGFYVLNVMANEETKQYKLIKE